jgi:plasmid maintenance system antidote protein VapI
MTPALIDARRDSAAVKLALSDLLWSELERLDITVGGLVSLTGLSDQTVRDIVAGASDPSLSRVLRIERALGRPPGWIARTLAA